MSLRARQGLTGAPSLGPRQLWPGLGQMWLGRSRSCADGGAQVSPLTTFVEVIRTRDASTILPPLALMEAIYGGLWAAYIRANARTARSADFGGLSPFCFRPKSTSERARLAVSAAGMAWHSTTCTYGCRTQSAR